MEGFSRSADRLEEVLADIDKTESEELVIRGQMKQETSRIETMLSARQAAWSTSSPARGCHRSGAAAPGRGAGEAPAGLRKHA